MKERIICKDRYGLDHVVPRKKLVFRIGICAILRKEDKVFLFKDPSTNKFELPGGAVETGETIEEALVREFKEETGLLIKIGEFLTYRESFFYIASKKKGYQNIRLFFSASKIMKRLQTSKKQIIGDYYGFDYLTPLNTNELTYSVLKEIFVSPNI